TVAAPRIWATRAGLYTLPHGSVKVGVNEKTPVAVGVPLRISCWAPVPGASPGGSVPVIVPTVRGGVPPKTIVALYEVPVLPSSSGEKLDIGALTENCAVSLNIPSNTVISTASENATG